MSPRAGHEDVAGKIAAALERIGQAERVLVQREAQERGLSPTQLRLLLRLAVDPAERRRPGALARELDVSAASLSDSIAALQDKGLIERRRVEDDRRRISLGLTRAGRRLARQVEPVTAPIERAVATLPPAQRLALMRSLFDVIAALQRDGVVTVARMCVTCRHFRPRVHAGERPHHCALLDMPLAEHSLRVDCPEHELAA
jgi:DNA-binding MarR family transcriptional regulator